MGIKRLDEDYNVAFLDRHMERLQRIVGHTWRKPYIAYVGHPLRYADKNKWWLKAEPGVDARDSGMIFVHNLSEQRTDGTVIPGAPYMVSNTGEGAVKEDELAFGTPLQVKRTNAGTRVFGTGGAEHARYYEGVLVGLQRTVAANQLDIGLLKPTAPAPSMRVRCSLAFVNIKNTQYLMDAFVTDDLTASVPGSGLARAVMVEWDGLTEAPVLTAGSTYSYDPVTDEPALLDGYRASYYPATLNEDRIMIGWVRLWNGMANIRNIDILPALELITKGVPDSVPTDVLDRILVANGLVLVANGHVLYS